MEWRTRERWQAIYLEVKEDDEEYQIKKNVSSEKREK